MFEHSNSMLSVWLEDTLGKSWSQIDTEYYPLLQARYPILLTSLYLLSVLLLQPSKKQEAENKARAKADPKSTKSPTLTGIVFIHNLLLCVFSLFCFVRSVPTTWRITLSPSTRLSITCANDNAYNKEWYAEYSVEFGLWMYLFYLSKYWEFIDTWIVIAKGRRPIFLQVFHHIGVVYGMYFGVVSRMPSLFIMINLNSGIHTVMYAYYAASSIGIRFPYKALITRMQMGQFIIGNIVLASHMVLLYSCSPWPEFFAGAYLLVYVSLLLYLFSMFFKRTYKEKKTKKRID